MNIREVTALVLLYRACPDAALRARAERLVPGLEEFAAAAQPSDVANDDGPCDPRYLMHTEEHARRSLRDMKVDLALGRLRKGEYYPEVLKLLAKWPGIKIKEWIVEEEM